MTPNDNSSMRRGTRCVIGLATAALTFGSLWAFVGPKHRDHAPWHMAQQGHWHQGGGCHGDGHQEKVGNATENPVKESPTF